MDKNPVLTAQNLPGPDSCTATKCVGYSTDLVGARELVGACQKQPKHQEDR